MLTMCLLSVCLEQRPAVHMQNLVERSIPGQPPELYLSTDIL